MVHVSTMCSYPDFRASVYNQSLFKTVSPAPSVRSKPDGVAAGSGETKNMHGFYMNSCNRRKSSRFEVHVEPSTSSDEESEGIPERDEITTINVGGVHFETYKKTLKRIPGTRLARLCPTSQYFNKSKQEYFFDRDPEVFRAVLNYHRLGELHIPLHMCGPSLERELKYWGIPEELIQKCCWIHYIQLKSQKYSLADFECYFADHQYEKLLGNGGHSRTRFRLWNIMNKPSSSKLALTYAIFISLVVLLSIFTFLAETHPWMRQQAGQHHGQAHPVNHSVSTSGNSTSAVLLHSGAQAILEMIDYVCLVIFTLDIVLRLCIAPNRLQFLRNPVVVIEILAVIPYFVDVGVHIADAIQVREAEQLLSVIHVLRIFGVLRVFKILRYYSGLQVLVYTLRSSCKDLLLMLTFIGVACLFFSSLIFFVDDRKKFDSIPRGFWWSIITMTTVGYGDLYPTTTPGYVVGSCCALVGVLVVAFTVPILVNSFMLYYSHAQSIIPYKREASKSYKQASTRAYLENSLQSLKRISLRPLSLESDLFKKRTPNASSHGEQKPGAKPQASVEVNPFAMNATPPVQNKTSSNSVATREVTESRTEPTKVTTQPFGTGRRRTDEDIALDRQRLNNKSLRRMKLITAESPTVVPICSSEESIRTESDEELEDEDLETVSELHPLHSSSIRVTCHTKDH